MDTTTPRGKVRDNLKVKCPECGRTFNLANETDAQEWYYGHDCEVE